MLTFHPLCNDTTRNQPQHQWEVTSYPHSNYASVLIYNNHVAVTQLPTDRQMYKPASAVAPTPHYQIHHRFKYLNVYSLVWRYGTIRKSKRKNKNTADLDVLQASFLPNQEAISSEQEQKWEESREESWLTLVCYDVYKMINGGSNSQCFIVNRIIVK